jgi:hypothetical protein
VIAHVTECTSVDWLLSAFGVEPDIGWLGGSDCRGVKLLNLIQHDLFVLGSVAHCGYDPEATPVSSSVGQLKDRDLLLWLDQRALEDGCDPLAQD